MKKLTTTLLALTALTLLAVGCSGIPTTPGSTTRPSTLDKIDQGVTVTSEVAKDPVVQAAASVIPYGTLVLTILGLATGTWLTARKVYKTETSPAVTAPVTSPPKA